MAHNERQPGKKSEYETVPTQPDSTAAHEQLANERERNAERSQEISPDTAHHEAIEQAKSIERTANQERQLAGEQKAVAERRRPMNNAQKDASFNKTMETVQAELTGASRTFSKVIHNKAVERTSEIAGQTIARPNAILAGSIAAFICTLGIYLMAKHYGYQLSGFETIAAFIFGWLIGQLFDFFRVMITGKR